MRIPLIFSVLLFVLGCGSKASKEDQDIEKRQYLSKPNQVEVIVLQPMDFRKELISNGNLKATKKSILKFSISEELIKLNYRNGDYVKKGATIAELASTDQRSRIEKGKTSLKKAELELADFLLGHGNLELKDTARIAPELLVIAKIRSGYQDAMQELRSAQEEYASCFLKAPFSGKIANLNYKLFEQVSPGEEFCTLIDDSVFEVEFSVLETELKDIEVGKVARIAPFSMESTFQGSITEINPMVDENGLVTAKAVVKNTGNLMEGMNVKIYIESMVPEQLVVPKEAIVLRQNQEVLFKVVDGKAYWTYAKTVNENSTSFSVIAHPDKGATLAPGDTVIVSGNLNLAHESDVEVKEE